MKSNRKTVLLLLVVILVWGFVIYRFYSWTEDADVNSIDPINLNNSVDYGQGDTINYQFNLNYQDPFLKPLHKKKKIQPKSTPTPTPDEIENIPSIQYLGMVSSSSRSNAMLTINGKSFIVNKGDRIEGIDILDYNDTDLTITFNATRHKYKISPNSN